VKSGLTPPPDGPMTVRILYVLHSGQLFGTERMALGTLQALGINAQALVLAPPGPVHVAAQAAGIATQVITSRLGLARAVGHCLLSRRHTAVVATGVLQSLLVWAFQALLAGRGPHLHVVHGGTDERLSYGRKRWLARLPVRLVAVSDFVRQRLLAHGVPGERITVIGNFLPSGPVAVRPRFVEDGVRRLVMLSRLDPIKRVGLLFDALDHAPVLRELAIDIYGSGAQEAVLRQRAAAYPNVQLHGFVPDAAAALGSADLLLHTCPEEPFGLVLLEAFAAGLPVLVPNSGGAGDLVEHEVNGWHFSANNPVALAHMLEGLRQAPASKLNAIARGGREALAQKHDRESQARAYAHLLKVEEALA
jgi:glycosyltransferase involved in cell wall biosynthesis